MPLQNSEWLNIKREPLEPSTMPHYKGFILLVNLFVNEFHFSSKFKNRMQTVSLFRFVWNDSFSHLTSPYSFNPFSWNVLKQRKLVSCYKRAVSALSPAPSYFFLLWGRRERGMEGEKRVVPLTYSLVCFFGLFFFLLIDHLFVFFKRFYSFIFKQRGRKRGKHQCMIASCTPPTGDLACNPGMCIEWESNRWPFGLQTGTQSTEPHQARASLVDSCICPDRGFHNHDAVANWVLSQGPNLSICFCCSVNSRIYRTDLGGKKACLCACKDEEQVQWRKYKFSLGALR